MNPQPSSEVSAKLTNWQNEPSLQALLLDYQTAKPSHDAQSTKIQRWNNLLKVEGEAKPKKVKGRSSVQPPLIRRQAEWRYSALTEPFLNSQKMVEVKPRTFEDGNAARQNELVLNYQFDTKLNKVKFFDDFVRSTVDDGTCIVQIGWCRKTVPITQDVPVWTYYQLSTPEEVQTFQQALEASQSDHRTFTEQAPPELVEAVKYYAETGNPNRAEQTGTEKQTIEMPVVNHPTATILDPMNVMIDPSCNGDASKAKFIMVSFETCKADLQAEGKRYRNLDRVNWEAATPATTPDHRTNTPTDFNFQDIARKRVVAVEYWGFWDIAGDGVLVPIVATWIGTTLIRMEKNPFPDQALPFVIVPYLPVKRQVHGEPDAELLEDNQKILGALMRGMIDLLGRSANSQQGFAKGMLDPLNRRRFENGQDYEFNPNLSPTQGLISHTYPELPVSAMTMLQLQNQEAESLTGVKSFAGGVSGDSYGDVAAGIRGALDAASKREMAILRRLARGVTEIATKFAAMNAVFLSEEEVVRITNEKFETVRREDLKGQFDFVVDISTAEVDNAKSQDLAFMLQTLGNTVDISITLFILAEICRLKRMPELEHKLKTFKPEPTQMQQLEMQKLQEEINQIKSVTALNEAKAEEARAKAGQVQLDSEEQVTGIKHARDMDKQQGQAEGNKELEVTKALLQKRKPEETKPDVEAAVGYNTLTSRPPEVSSPSLPLPVDNYEENMEVSPTQPGFEPALVG